MTLLEKKLNTRWKPLDKSLKKLQSVNFIKIIETKGKRNIELTSTAHIFMNEVNLATNPLFKKIAARYEKKEEHKTSQELVTEIIENADHLKNLKQIMHLKISELQNRGTNPTKAIQQTIQDQLLEQIKKKTPTYTNHPKAIATQKKQNKKIEKETKLIQKYAKTKAIQIMQETNKKEKTIQKILGIIEEGTE